MNVSANCSERNLDELGSDLSGRETYAILLSRISRFALCTDQDFTV